MTKTNFRYLLFNIPLLLIILFPLVMGSLVYSINLNSKQLDTSKTLNEYINSYLPYNASLPLSESVVALDYETINNYYMSNFEYYYQESSYWYVETDNNITYEVYVSLPNFTCPTEESLNFDIFALLEYYLSNQDYEGLGGYVEAIQLYNWEYYEPFFDTLSELMNTSIDNGINYNDTNLATITGSVYKNLFLYFVAPSGDYTTLNFGLPPFLFNYIYYVLVCFITYYFMYVLIFLPRLSMQVLDKVLNKFGGRYEN